MKYKILIVDDDRELLKMLNQYFTLKNYTVMIAENGIKAMEKISANGVPMKMIQEWLGHSDFSTTANIYSHLDYASKVSSAEAMLDGLGMGSNPENDT